MDERTKAIISAVVVIVVNVASLFGMSLNLNELTNAAFTIATLVTTCVACWKNFNFTPEAAQAQKYLNQLKGKE